MWTAIALAVIVAGSLAGLRLNLRTRLDRATRSSDASAREQAEALREIARNIEKGRSAGHGLY